VLKAQTGLQEKEKPSPVFSSQKDAANQGDVGNYMLGNLSGLSPPAGMLGEIQLGEQHLPCQQEINLVVSELESESIFS